MEMRSVKSRRGLFDDPMEGDYENTEVIKNVHDFWEANSESESESGSGSGSGSEGEGQGGDVGSRKKVRLLSFRKLKQKMYNQYDVSIVHKYSTALDLFVRYIQCYHILYSEASYYCNYKLNLFMLPCLFLSTSCSVLMAIQYDGINMPMLLSILNGCVTFLLAMINHLKLDANAEAHKISAYQYAKLKSQIEFHSGELLLYENDPLLSNASNGGGGGVEGAKDKKEKEFIQKVHSIIVMIKETLKNVEDNNNFSLPPHILSKYSTIYNMNIFLHIKSIDTYKNIVLNDLRNVKNEMRFYSKMGQTKDESLKEKYMILYEKKNRLLQEFLELNKGYSLVDSMLQQEITNIGLYTRYWGLFYLQNIMDALVACCGGACCGGDRRWNILPRGYKKSTEIGYRDANGDYLLEKVLRDGC